MKTTLHDMRNELAVVVATMHAFADGMLEPNRERFGDILESLDALTAMVSTLHTAAPEASVRPKEDLLNAIIEGSPYAKILVNDRGRITLVNAQAEKLFGYARAELLGESIEMLVPKESRHEHPGLRAAFNEKPAARSMGAGRDLYGRRKDGSKIPIEIGLNPIKTEAESFTLAAVTDITERKRVEELRLLHSGAERHAAELEELNKELASASYFKTQFVATMSHELRTPLTAIIGAAELLNRAKLDERAKISAQTINESAEALLALISSVLDFSKIEAGKLELQATTFSVETILEGAADVVAQLAREKGLTLHTYVEPDIPPVLGDGDRLRQILLNLIGNAVKFTERGDVIVRATRLDADDSAVHLRFEVQDTGIGIPSEVLPRLFEPFVQADDSASRRFGGTGLGLSISKRLVELMDGEIGIESEPGGGSMFWFTARFAPGVGPLARYERKLEGLGGLILSGDETFAQIVQAYMTSWGIQSRRAATRADVIEALKSTESVTWVALVDLDNMGVPDIGMTIDILRAMLPARVIAIGNDGPLRKPIRQSQIFDAIVRSVEVTAHPSLDATVRSVPTPTMTQPGNPVLVAEDNARLQRILQLQFDELGVPVTFVSDGLQAVQALRRDTYAMVFMDCQMPHMDGLTATKTVREAERETATYVPIVAMTANALTEDRDACIAAGMDDYLAKPVKLADLRGMIERWSKRLVADS